MRAAQPSVMFIETSDISVESHLDGLLGHLVEQGMEVCAVSDDSGRLTDVGERNGVRTFPVPMTRDPSPLRDLGSLLRLVRAIRLERPRTVVYGTPKASLLGAIAAWATRVPERVYVIHGLRVETMTGATRRLYLALDGLVERLSSVTVAVGNGLADRAVEIGAVTNRPRVLGPGSAQGVDITRFSPTPDGPEHEGFVIGFVGRVTADKGLDSLVSAFRGVQNAAPEARMVIVGAPEGMHTLRPETRDELRSNDAISMVGESKDVRATMRSFDVLCLPTRREGLPTVLMEAAACGVPIVATAATGVTDVVDVSDAWIVDVDDTAALEKALIDAWQRPAERRDRAERALVKVRQRFDRVTVWNRWHDFFAGLAETGAATGSQPKVLWLSKGLDEGGAETLLLELASQDALAGFEIHVATVLQSATQLVPRFRRLGVRVHGLGGRRTIDLKWIWELRALMKRERFAIVHSHSPLPASVARVLARTLRPAPATLTTEHSTRALYHPATQLANQITSQLDARRVAVSKAACDHSSLLDSRELEVVYHGVSVAEDGPDVVAEERRRLRRSWGVEAGEVVIIAVANMRPEKNLSLLVRAFADVNRSDPGARLVLVGDGVERQRLEQLVEDLGLDSSVVFAGRVPQARRLLVGADIGALSSSHEGLPVFMMECLSVGLPIVATAVGGVGELVVDGENGLLVQQGGEAAFASALNRLVSDVDLRQRLAAGARRSSTKFAIQTAADRHRTIYHDLAGGFASR